jgi:hypothetical protein
MPEGAFTLHRDDHSFAVTAATNILPKTVVKWAGTNSIMVAPVATAADEPCGVVEATYLSGETVALYEELQYVKVNAAASVGVGARLIVGSTNGRLVPGGITASGHFSPGVSVTEARDGETFTMYVRVRKA